MRTLLRCLIIAPLLLTSGCGRNEPGDRRAAEMAGRVAEQQGRHNEQAARQSTETAAAARHLIEAQAALQKELQAERAAIDQDRRDLERERRELAASRVREPVIAEAIRGVGMLLACLIPLLLAGYVIHVACRGSDDAVLQEFLLRERGTDPLSTPAIPPAEPPLRRLLRRVVLRHRRTDG
jgi:hypothetical protein